MTAKADPARNTSTNTHRQATRQRQVQSMHNTAISPQENETAATSENVHDISANGITYRAVLPHAGVDYIQSKLATSKTPYELPMLEDMGLRLGADDLVIDAGANIGNHTLYLAAVVGCRVTAFEPNAELAAALRSSLALNQLQKKAEVRQLALGKHAAHGHFAKAIPDNLGAQSIAEGDGPLQIESLDSITFPSAVKAIKIDVEGMELAVLQGAQELVRRDRPIIYVECADPASFRQVHHWMTLQNYGYWDTFNATPTHLFLPNEQTTMDQRLSRLQLKAAQDIYQLQEQISSTRATLDASNLKYRAANEQITSLKLQLAEHEAARRAAELADSSSKDQLERTRGRLESERAQLQQELQRLSAQSDTHRQVAHDAEKQLIRIESALLVANARAAEAQERAEQAKAEQERHSTLASELEEKLAATAAQLTTTRDSLNEANRKYRLVTEQVQNLQAKAVQEDAASRQSADVAAKGTTQLIETQAQLLAEKTGLQAEIVTLRQEWQAATLAAHAAEKEQVRIESRWEVASEALSKASSELQTEREAAQATIARLQDDLQRVKQSAQVVEKQLMQLELTSEFDKRTSAAEQTRLRAERDLLKGERTSLLTERDNFKLERDAVQGEHAVLVVERDALKGERDALRTQHGSLQDERNVLQSRHDSLTVERDTLHVERRTLLDERDKLALERDTVIGERNSLAGERDTLLSERVGLAAALDRVTGERDGLASEHEALASEYEALASEREALLGERDVLADERDLLLGERAALASERDTLVCARDAMQDDRDMLLDQRDRMISERDALHAEITTLEAALAQARTDASALAQRQSDNENQWLEEIESLSKTQRLLEDELQILRTELSSALDAASKARQQYQRAEAELVEQGQLLTDRATLRDQLAAIQGELAQAVASTGESRQAMLAMEAELKLAQERATESGAERALAQQTITTLQAKLVVEEHAAKSAEALWGSSQVELGQLRSELDAKIAALRTECDLGKQVQRQAELRATDLSRQLNEVSLKYRRVHNEEIPHLKGQIQTSHGELRQHQHAVTQLKAELAAQKKTLAETSLQLERARHQTMQAEQQIIKTRASLSFQLGYILINGVKSVRAFLGLPAALLGWRNEAARRRRKTAERLRKLEAAPAVPAKARTPARPATPAAPVTSQAAPAPAVPAALAPAAAPVFTPPDGLAPTPSLDRLAPAHAVAEPAPAPAASAARDLRQLKVACIMDEFTFGSYRAECDLYQLTPSNWEAELAAFAPELLFIESAWRGKDELWGSKVGHTSQELQGIVAWCRQRGVPTVFWNKEDPVHFETFLNTAMLFDRVFTTDIDCIHRYKAALKHEQVFLLPFACQPNNNHPIETFERKDAFCFAGAYYVRYPDRTRDLGNFIGELPAFRPIEIYDRNFGKNDPNYQFPPEYQPYIVGTLPFDQIDKAYKGYRYAINLNSIKQSQTMFARRVFELMASNTITVSNFSRGIRLLFGDLVVTTDSGHEVVRHLEAVAGDAVRSAKLRLAALRKVLSEHTYEHRLAYVYSKVADQPPLLRRPRFVVLASAENQGQLDRILANVVRQQYAGWQLVVVLAGAFSPATVPRPEVRFIARDTAADLSIAAIAGEADFLIAMPANDYYGPHYLTDLALATTFSSAEVLGKIAQYAWDGHQPVLEAADASYRPATRFALRSAAVRVSLVATTNLADCADAVSTATLDTENGLAIDEFNYCRDGQIELACSAVQAVVDDLPGLDTGIAIDELLKLAEQIAPAPAGIEGGKSISGKQMAAAFTRQPSQALKAELDGDHWWFQSSLPDGSHEYLYATEDWKLDSLGWTDRAEFYLDTTPGLNIQMVLVFLDAQKQKISHVIKHANRNQDAEIPVGTVSVRLGLRMYAGGSAVIQSFVLGHRNLQPAEIIGKAEHLVLTNHYPSYQDLYRNGFVHSRVIAYREHGIRSDVFRMRPAEPVSYHEFENVDVTTGSQEVLHQMLLSGRYKTVMVHFLEPAMWEVLQHHLDRVKVVIWIHGAEIQPWHRRDYNYVTEDERTVAKMKSAARMEFWRGLLDPMPANVKLVFVSRYFAEEVMEDMGFRIPEGHYSIIHNPIDTDVFSYQPKGPEQRKKVLSIRPYASAKYANDLSVKAIQLLAHKPWFKDMEFRMVGDGPLFDSILAPLREYKNVFIERRFLKQSEIAALHKQYGIFLSPTRMDAQGVSRDEAMASGLVPVTNGVTAIPEFVDAQCGILAAGEDAQAMADGMAALYEDPALFAAMSANAAQRVARQSAKSIIVEAEIKELT